MTTDLWQAAKAAHIAENPDLDAEQLEAEFERNHPLAAAAWRAGFAAGSRTVLAGAINGMND